MRMLLVSLAVPCSAILAGATLPGTTTSMPAVDMSKLPQPATGHADERVRVTDERPGRSDNGDFRTVCDMSHMAPDDPIVFPGQPGRSHLHTFFGNTSVDAHSTAESIAEGGNSTCRGGTVNRSAYWVPSMVDMRDGAPVKPVTAHFYYKTGYELVPSKINPPPAGLRMIAGDANSKSEQAMAWYTCQGTGDGKDRRSRSIPNCPIGSELWQVIHFPQCWDGKNLDSPDHRSHMAYPRGGRCPASHPVAIPEITFNVVYRVTGHDHPMGWRLSSDNYALRSPGGYSSHGDWVNGWKHEIAESWAKSCNRARVDCHSHLLGDGRAIY